MLAKIPLLLCFLGCSAAPKEYASFVDQRQSGDYNIHIDLKDVQIIALLGGHGGDTDYDYNYDYADMTIKPQNGSTTVAAANSTVDEAAVSVTTPISTTENIVEITPSPIKPIQNVTPLNETAAEPTTLKAPLDPVPYVVTPILEIEKESPKPESENEVASTPQPETVAPTILQTPQQNYSSLQPDQIPVQVIITPVQVPTTEKHYRLENRAETVTRIRNHHLNYAECPTGFVRDNHGRCFKKQSAEKQAAPQLTLQKLVELSQKMKQARRDAR